jgi:ketosteroid isomerase-like protein
MKKKLSCVLVSFFALALVARAADREKLKAELIRTEAEFFRHALEHGFSAGMHAYMADDAFIANSLTLGREAQGAKLNAEKPATKTRANVIRWKPLRADVSESGDLGYTWGVAESGPAKEGPFKPYGIYVTIWKREADGKWKFVYDASTNLSADRVEAFVRERFPSAAAIGPDVK